MATVALSVLAMFVIKAVAGRIYKDCKAAVWLMVAVTVVLCAALFVTVIGKVALIPVFLLFR